MPCWWGSLPQSKTQKLPDYASLENGYSSSGPVMREMHNLVTGMTPPVEENGSRILGSTCELRQVLLNLLY